jgi:hypothetical protein
MPAPSSLPGAGRTARGGRVAALGGAVLAAVLTAGAMANGPRFYPDDPIWVDPETQDASDTARHRPSLYYDFLDSTFFKPGDRTDRRALNVNTLDEVPDSSWFTNRIGRRPLSLEELARGPDEGGPAPGPWTIVSSKTEGISPGIVVNDAAGMLYFVKFDPVAYPELGSGAEIVSTKIFHALGYHVPEIYIPHVRREDLRLSPETLIEEPDGRRRPMTAADLEALLARAARHPDGTFRVIAGKAVPGRPIGPFRYYGTRPDDPNDIFPHEHRRELRAIRVFAAWLAHNDLKSDNTLDTLIDVGGRRIVRHYIRDFNSTLGSSSIYAKQRREGHEHIWEARPTFRRILTFGLYFDGWLLQRFPDIPSVGHFEAAYFRPERWRPTYPQPALDNARPDDTFWAARRVMAFTDDMLRAAVRTAQFSDPRAGPYLVETLAKRRDKIGRVWLTNVNPIVDVALDGSGRLSFANAAVEAGVAAPPASYRVRWFAFDNNTGQSSPASDEEALQSPEMQAPATLLTREYLVAEIRAIHADHPSWAEPVRAFFRRAGSGWQTVGFERLPDRR